MAKKEGFKLKGYTSDVPEIRTISQIEQKLQELGARKVMKEWDDQGKVISFAFVVNLEGREFAFKLPMNVDKVYAAFKKMESQGLIEGKYCREEQARRVGWRIILNWIESQFSMLQVELMELPQMLLPHMYDMRRNETFYDRIKGNNFKLIDHKDDYDNHESHRSP